MIRLLRFSTSSDLLRVDINRSGQRRRNNGDELLQEGQLRLFSIDGRVVQVCGGEGFTKAVVLLLEVEDNVVNESERWFLEQFIRQRWVLDERLQLLLRCRPKVLFRHAE